MIEELEVIQRVLAGDAESFRLLVERYAGPVARMVRNLTGDSHTCEDLAQEVFLAAYTKLGTFDPGRSRFSTWLFTIARNRAVNALKKKKPRYVATPPECVDARTPEKEMQKRELFDTLGRELRNLPLNQRTAFVLGQIEQLPYETIAQIEGVRVGTIKSRVNRARSKLMEALKRFEEDTP